MKTLNPILYLFLLFTTYFLTGQEKTPGGSMAELHVGVQPGFSIRHLEIFGGDVIASNTGFCFGGSIGHGLSDKVAVYFRTDLTQNNIDNNFFYEYFRLVNLEGGLNLYFRIPDTKLYPYIDTSWGLRVLNLQKTGPSQQVAGIFSVGGGIDVVQGTAISIGCGLVYDWFNINYKASFGTYFADENGIPPIDDQKITTHRIVLGIAFWTRNYLN